MITPFEQQAGCFDLIQVKYRLIVEFDVIEKQDSEVINKCLELVHPRVQS